MTIQIETFQCPISTRGKAKGSFINDVTPRRGGGWSFCDKTTEGLRQRRVTEGGEGVRKFLKFWMPPKVVFIRIILSLYFQKNDGEIKKFDSEATFLFALQALQ